METAEKVIDLAVFMGQSNMAGRGVAQKAPKVTEGMGYEYRAITQPDRLCPLQEPFGVEENNPQGVYEPGMKTGSAVSAFVNACVELTQVPIVGISCAKGGSAIAEWMPGTPYYKDALERTRRGKKWLSENGYTIRHCYMVWCQGCTDGDLGTEKEVYRKNTEDMIEAFLQEAGLEVCFLIQIGNHRDKPELYVPMQQAQEELAAENEKIVMVSRQLRTFAAKGLMKDEFHYLQEGYNLVGEEAGRKAAEYMEGFRLNYHTEIIHEAGEDKAVKLACARFRRDMEKVLKPSEKNGCKIVLKKKPLQPEQYEIRVLPEEIQISGGDARAFIYALDLLSEKYLGILPFWFWNDQQFDKKEEVPIPCGKLTSPEMRIKYRGWFINDEVLISHWDAGVSEEYPWEMVFEALLRCGGNLVIPGTDANAKRYASLASDMGLMITHHHAEPLGAEMFLRKYPDLEPSYLKYAQLFETLWQEAIERQKGEQVVWNIGFRGQGDMPFWANDPVYDTPQKRGELISSIMKKQYDMVKKQVPDAVFCTNLYGEILELYEGGYLSVPEDVIFIWADNGYGKMVSRRQGNHNPRIPALPKPKDAGRHGTYYHVSFYDLQAANHITMLPNSMEFVERELTEAMQHGITELWIINASNIKPHVYPLAFIANLWKKDALTAENHRKRYIEQYYSKNSTTEDLAQMEQCICRYPQVTLPFGSLEDEHAGEQFYNYAVRDFIHGWMKDGAASPRRELFWCVEGESFQEQVEWFAQKCKAAYERFEALYESCCKIKGNGLWEDSVLLQAEIHKDCLQGTLFFADAFRAYKDGAYQKTFFLLGNAAEAFEGADKAMRMREHDKWKDFYKNECLTDVKETAYCLKRLMGYIRNLGDGPDFYGWQREVIYPEKDRKVVLITNMENHLTDWELYLAGKNKIGKEC